MKKIIGILLVIALTATMIAGCGKKEKPASSEEAAASTEVSETEEAAEETAEEVSTEADGDGPIIGYICKDLSQQWFIQVTDELEKNAKALGAQEVVLMDTAMNPEKYLTALDNMISQKVDIIIVCPPDQKLSQTTVERCAAAGIKVFADADGLIDENGKHIAPALELDAYTVGASAGEWLGNYVIENKINENTEEVAYLALTMETVSSAAPRSEGSIDAFKKEVSDFPEDKIIKADYDGTSEKAFNVATATITANPDIKTWIVTAPNDEGAQGVARALEQAGKDKEATVVGLGGYLAKDEFKKDYSCFKAAGYFMASEDGKVIAEAAMKWVNEDIVPFTEHIKDGEEFGVYPLGAVMVDPSNYEEIMGDDAK